MQGRLTIDLAALADNFRLLKDKVGAACRVAAVVKADSYGLGMAACAEALEQAGAEEFFVATLPEAIALRTIINEKSEVFVLGGFDSRYGDIYREENITPVISSLEQLAGYIALYDGNSKLPAIVHFDTGMNRLGLRAGEIDVDLLDALDIRYVMSHFACSDEAGHEINERQYAAFEKICAAFSGVPATLCNSSGIFRADKYHFEMVRPGMALYGLNPVPEQKNPMRPVVSLDVPVLQIKTAKKGETCGYGASHRFEKDTKIAILSLGYADGFFRAHSNNAKLYWNGIACPVRGRVSMDLCVIDLTDVPENALPKAGDFIEVIGPHQSADDLALSAGTIGYEILTALGHRYERIYK